MSRRLRKIVFVVFSLRGGGAERVVIHLAGALKDHVKVTIIQLSNLTPFFNPPSGVRLVRYDGPQSGPLRYVALARYLHQSLRKESADVVLSFGETINPFVIAIARLAGQVVIVSNRASPLASLRGRRAWLNPLLYGHASAVIVQTKRAVEMLSQRYRHRHWIVSENPVHVPREVPDDQHRENVCVTVGYLGGQKNQGMLIESFLRVAPPEWQLSIVGDGPHRLMLENKAKELGGADRVTFTGAVKDVAEILVRARVFAFTSLSEGFPNALAEGMAYGCACIALDCPTGPSELIDHGRSGFLIPPDDTAAFDRGLADLIASSSLRSAFAREARTRAMKLDADRVAIALLLEVERHLPPLQSAPANRTSR